MSEPKWEDTTPVNAAPTWDQTTPVGDTKGGTKPDEPLESDIYGSDLNRLKAGFGDPAGIELSGSLGEGFHSARRNASGDVVVKGPDGRWHKDASSLFRHPINWLESAVSGAPATAGMMMGGAAGGAIGGLASPPTALYTAPAGAIAGAGAGAAAGENLRQGVGGMMGVYSGQDRAADLVQEGANGALAEGGAKILGQVAAKPVAYATDKAGQAWAKMASLLSGKDSADVLRTTQRRGKVFSPRGTQEIAKDMAEELKVRGKAETAAHGAAADAFHANDAENVVSTDPVFREGSARLERVKPGASEEGTLSPEEYATLSARRKDNLFTRMTPVGERIAYGKPDVQPVSAPVPEMVRPDYSSINPSEMTPRRINGRPEYTDEQLRRMSEISGKAAAENLKRLNGANPYEAIPVGISAVDRSLEKTGDSVPVNSSRSLGQLLEYYKGLVSDVDKGMAALPDPNHKLPGNVAFMKSEAGMVKNLIHENSPTLKAGDNRFSKYAHNSNHLTPVLNEKTQQGFLDSLISSDKKDNARDAASMLVPKSYEDALDLGANREWKKPGDKLFGVSKRLATQLALGAVGAEAARETHSPWTLLPAAAIATAISPRAHLAGIKYGPALLRQIPAAAAKNSIIKRFSPFTVEDKEK